MLSTDKIVADVQDIEKHIEALPRPLVFTNGCFDIIHSGHVSYLEEAATLGKSLVVGLNTDASIKRLGKGDDRPINTLEDRAVLLAALGCVSLVIPFDEDTPTELIKQVKPDMLVKGGDYTVDQIVGAEVVHAYGGEVRAIPLRYQRSVTTLLERIRSAK